MKVKQQPDDFQVEEITDVVPVGEGPFALYRLEKRGWSTPDALGAVRQRWHIEPRRLSFGGLKDRHAHTTQYLTIFHGPQRGLRHHDVEVRYLGQVRDAYVSGDVRCNRFRVTLRDLAPEAQLDIERRIAQVAAQGVPNYFDDQRFGSVAGEGGELIGRLLVRGQFEEALRLALTGPYDHDRAAQKQEKATLAKHWGDWARCQGLLPRGHARSMVVYLRACPGDVRGAVVRLRPELRGLYLSAYQSHLWNRVLARWLETNCRPEQLRLVHLRLGAVPFHARLAPAELERLAALQLPLPTARWRPEAEDERLEAVRAVLAEEGMELRDLQVKGVRELFFSRGERAALCRPAGLEFELGDDELTRGRSRLMLRFELPRGSYATLLLKAVGSSERQAGD